MYVITNSIRQMFRTPARSVLFTVLIALSTTLLSLGISLRLVSQRNLRELESSFTTIGTVQQIPNVIKTVATWNAGLESYLYFNKAVYDSEILSSVLSFDNAGYIHAPEKRPYYGAYYEDYVRGQNEIDTNAHWIILEAEPLEDCVPAGPVILRVKKVLRGSVGSDEIWFCDHYNETPAPMYAGRTYIMFVQTYPVSTHAGYESFEMEYQPAGDIESTQFDKDGVRIPDLFGSDDNGWEEVSEGYYDTPRGQRWRELEIGIDKFDKTIPVVPTNATRLLMPFYKGEANIVEGRDISGEEYEQGARVCLIQRRFAANNRLKVGDTLPLALYYANYRESASHNFSLTGGGGFGFGLLNAQGKSYPVFEEGDYIIVGIYEATGGASYLLSGFEAANNMVVIPSASVRNSDENNILSYGPMQAYNTSFEIPNGMVDTFTEAWNLQSIAGLDIRFYDKGYSRLKDGLDRMRGISLVLLLVGAAVSVLTLALFTRLFITGAKKRTAIERSLGLGRVKCAVSLLSGMLLVVLLGTSIGSGVGYLLNDSVLEKTMAANEEMMFDTTYSNWVNSADEETDAGVDLQTAGYTLFVSTGLMVLIMGTMFAVVGVYGNLKAEPLVMLSTRDME